MDNENNTNNIAESDSIEKINPKDNSRIKKSMFKPGGVHIKRWTSLIILIAFMIIIIVFTLLISGAFKKEPVMVIETGKSIIPKEIIETFEISALDYAYSAIIFETTTVERKFLFFDLKPASQMYAVQYEGLIKIGIDGKEIEVDEQYIGEQQILKVTIPKTKILAHDAPLNDTCKVIFDIGEKMENANISQYINLFNEKKKETENDVKESGLLKRAQESARKQLEAFLNAIPDIRENYELIFELEE